MATHTVLDGGGGALGFKELSGWDENKNEECKPDGTGLGGQVPKAADSPTGLGGGWVPKAAGTPTGPGAGAHRHPPPERPWRAQHSTSAELVAQPLCKPGHRAAQPLTEQKGKPAQNGQGAQRHRRTQAPRQTPKGCALEACRSADGLSQEQPCLVRVGPGSKTVAAGIHLLTSLLATT